MSEHIETIVIGGGQAGLAVGYHLHRRDLPFLILDENPRIGDVWRNRWDSLRLFTPASYSGLPGMAFPGPGSAYPTKDETAAYFEAYAEKFGIPVRTGVKVDRLSDGGDGFVVSAGDAQLVADNVVVATGAYQHQRVPTFATHLDKSIVQLRSNEYRNPDQLREGGVLVVGAGNSGSEIALDVVGRHPVWLSGPDTGQEPTRAGSIPDRLLTPLMWLAATRLTVRTAPGRKLRDTFTNPPRGIPLGRVRRKDITAAGIERVPRTVGVSDGCPVLEDGRVLEVSNVIWCTGFTPNYDWIDLPIATDNGFPIHDRGIVESPPGLYFIGLLFLYSLSSALVGGVGRDADYIVDHIVSTRQDGRQGMRAHKAQR
jgi:putative flavoprotein involved in K+ transport